MNTTLNNKISARAFFNGPRALAALFAVAVLALFLLAPAAARADDEQGYFRINSSDIFAPGGDRPYVNLSATDVDTVELRVYRLRDPMAFFKDQSDFHHPNPNKVGKRVSAADIVHEFDTTAVDGYRKIMQGLTTSEARETAVADFKISFDEPKPKTKKTFPLLSRAKGYELAAIIKHQVNARTSQDNDYERIDLPVLNRGTYLVEAVGADMSAYAVVFVTDLRFLDKSGQKTKMLFICNGKSGRPIKDADVLFVRSYISDVPVAAKTGPDGIVRLDRSQDEQVRYIIRSGDEFLPGDPYYYNDYEDSMKAYIFTDRPVYRPGHTVNFKGMLRKQNDHEYDVLKNKNITVKILDIEGTKEFESQYTTTDMGTFNGSFTIPDEPPLGSWDIEVTVDDNVAYGHFKVEEYKKPDYLVEVKPQKKSYIAGDAVRATITANYFFGEPVAEADVEYFIYTSRYWTPWWQEYGADYQYSWYYASSEDYETYGDQQLVDKGKGVLDKDGNLSIEIAGRKLEYDSVYRIVAKVTDKNHHEIEGSGMVKVARGLFSIGLSTSRYCYEKGDLVNVNVGAKTIDGDPVSTGLSVSLKRNYYEEDTPGHWKNVSKEFATTTLATDTSGKSVYTFTPGGSGEYQATFSGTDARGNTIDESYYIYVYEQGAGWYYPSGDGAEVKIVPDKKGYQAGETAKLVITSPVQDATLLITVEGGNVYEHKVVTIEGTNYLYELNLKKEFAPNVFVKATIVSNYNYMEGEQELAFPPIDKFLNITLETDKASYRPGDTAKVTATVTDSDGKPADAELSAGIVDESIYSIQQEIAPDIKKFFYGKQYNSVQTDFSTDFYTSGRSKTLQQYVASTQKPLRRGDLKGDTRDTVRKDFKDTMDWQPTLRTGEDGKVTFSAKCPDNLTTWRLTVRAADGRTRVGQSVLKFRERKNLIIRLAAPRFFREKDDVTLTASVHNYLAGDKSVKVSLSAVGLTISPTGERTIAVAKGGAVSVDWNAKVVPGVRNIIVTARAVSDEESDAVQFTIPYLPFGMEINETSYEEIRNDKSSGEIRANYPGGTEMKNAGLRLEISPTIAAGIFSSLDYLIAFPYGCVEQTMDSFMPDIAVAQAIKDSTVKSEPRFAKLPSMVRKGLDRLYDYQHEDGGWGWWKDDDTHPFMTAYVVYGLNVAKGAGYDVSESVFQRGIQSVKDQLKNKGEKIELITRVYMAYALTQTGDKDDALVREIYTHRNSTASLNNYGRALLGMSLKTIGLDKEAGIVAQEILNNATTSNGKTHWEGVHWNYNWQDDSNETTAQCIRALTAIKPGAKEIRSAAQWLVANRKGGDHWNSTRDTSMVVLALLEFARQTGELSADSTVQITVNKGKSISKQFTKKDAFSQPWVVSLAAADGLALGNTIKITKSGGAPLYINVTKNYFNSKLQIQPADNGFSVARTFRKLTSYKEGDKWLYRAEPIAADKVQTGDEILVTLKLTASGDSEYFMVEDFIPAGCEVVQDTRGYNITGTTFKGTDYEDEWYNEMDIRDEKVAFFSGWLPEKGAELSYILRAELPGEFHAMPAVASKMYFPDVKGNSNDYTLRIVNKD